MTGVLFLEAQNNDSKIVLPDITMFFEDNKLVQCCNQIVMYVCVNVYIYILYKY